MSVFAAVLGERGAVPLLADEHLVRVGDLELDSLP